MNDLRELVSRTVISKGKKIIRQNLKIDTQNDLNCILGCWVINHDYNARLLNSSCVKVTGSYEVNIWYSYDNNTKTDICRQTYTYEKEINTKNVVENYCKNNQDVIIECVESPTCINAYIDGMNICVECTFELLALIIGDAIVKVAVVNCPDVVDYIDDDLDEINENFINEGE